MKGKWYEEMAEENRNDNAHWKISKAMIYVKRMKNEEENTKI